MARRHATKNGGLYHNGTFLGRLPQARQQGDVVGVELRGGQLACRGGGGRGTLVIDKKINVIMIIR